MIMEKVVDFMDTEFAKDVLNPDEKLYSTNLAELQRTTM